MRFGQSMILFSCYKLDKAIFTQFSDVLCLDYIPTKKSEIIGGDKEIILNPVMYGPFQ